MKPFLGAFAIAVPLLVIVSATGPVAAQKTGGVLKMYSPDSPASMSIHEEATIVSERPMMGVFNNLVMFDQQVSQNSLTSIVPDLATGWYRNLAAVTTNGDYEGSFHLNRPQPAFLGLLASGYSRIYPCHVPPRDM